MKNEKDDRQSSHSPVGQIGVTDGKGKVVDFPKNLETVDEIRFFDLQKLRKVRSRLHGRILQDSGFIVPGALIEDLGKAHAVVMGKDDGLGFLTDKKTASLFRINQALGRKLRQSDADSVAVDRKMRGKLVGRGSLSPSASLFFLIYCLI